MFRKGLMTRIAVGLLAMSGLAQAQQEFPATLTGHAIMPAASFLPAPADAPTDLKTSGKYTTARRVDAPGTVMGKSYERETGVMLPFNGQPRQGHSGIKTMADGTFWIITDNGFGSKANSPDSMLYLNRYRIDWSAGTAAASPTIATRSATRRSPALSASGAPATPAGGPAERRRGSAAGRGGRNDTFHSPFVMVSIDKTDPRSGSTP